MRTISATTKRLSSIAQHPSAAHGSNQQSARTTKSHLGHLRGSTKTILVASNKQKRFCSWWWMGTTTTTVSLAWLLLLVVHRSMGFGSFLKFSHRPGTTVANGTNNQSIQSVTARAASSSLSSSPTTSFLESTVTAALWSFFAGDALASPTHWFYGGFPQVQSIYGPSGITGYTAPVLELPGSILNKSNLSGGGRSTSKAFNANAPTIVGHVINHGKQDLWSPTRQIHYHATLQAGENTLEAQLARVLMRSIVSQGGRFEANDFRQRYIQFMTTPGSHNDTYASTCHRMFFANWYYHHKPPVDCPDNDSHNVDTVDGLVLPTITALAVALTAEGTADQAGRQAAETAAVTRKSRHLEDYAQAWGRLVFDTVRSESPAVVDSATRRMAEQLRLRHPQVRRQDEITACYLDSAVPALLDTIVKYSSLDHSNDKKNDDHSNNISRVWQAMLANANTGGENVHRGSCLGAVLGAAAAVRSTSGTVAETTSWTELLEQSPLVTGLYHRNELKQEIHDFVRTVVNSGASVSAEVTAK
jgi:ADP-ribosyl-[dinitrogen reductase] hydrolase